MNKCHHSLNCLGKVPIFSHLNLDEQLEIHSTIISRSLKKDELLYQMGDLASSLYIVNSGQIKIYRLSKSGKEQVIRILNTGDFSGEMDLFHASYHRNYAQAMVDTEICEIKKEDFNEFLKKYPEITLRFLSEIARRLESAENQSFEITTGSVEERLATYLLESYQSQNSFMINLNMMKKDLASYLGTTPETLSRTLRKMEDDQLIRIIGSRQIEIIDLETIKELSSLSYIN